MAGDRLVIRSAPRPGRRLAWAAAAALAAAAAVVGAYRLGLHQGVGAARTAIAERPGLKARIEVLDEELRERRAELARLASAQRVDREAYARVRATLTRVQQENLELREELAFYRKVVAPSPQGSGLHLQRFALEPGPGPGEYRYTLTLVNVQGAKGRQAAARGRVELYVDGSGADGARRLALAEVAASGGTELTYAIRYFKHFEGTLRLPQGFEARTATIEVIPEDAEQPALEKRIAWPALRE